MINAFSDICLVMLASHVKGYSFPSKIYTLMGMAKPIIIMCSSECNAADFIIKTKSGWAFESDDCESFTDMIEKLYNNREQLDQIGANSLKVIEDGYTKQNIGSQYNDLVRDLCEQRH
ncbi:hypothetical protein SDC9_166586 [bioreactor metagenome]|uniref:Glycosyl transferase family 1 domain-containing protein n=1 Tax=bioreactor metagenome TaxID=1076179 RepID=A0A645FZZ6_9ZZZZ